jgi:hypothetical protein
LFFGKPKPKEPTASEEQPEPEDDSVLENSDTLNVPVEEHDSAYVVDIDGTPVVGDLLKIMFVEHKVVPTILVSFSPYKDRIVDLTFTGLFLPFSLEQFSPQRCL